MNKVLLVFAAVLIVVGGMYYVFTLPKSIEEGPREDIVQTEKETAVAPTDDTDTNIDTPETDTNTEIPAAPSVPVNKTTAGPPIPSELNEAIAGGVKWFKSAQEESGRFRYEYDVIAKEYLDNDNIVRQMGALYELGEILKGDKKNIFSLKETVKKAIQYAEANTTQGTFNGYEFHCVAKNSTKCTLGGTSLALAGALDFVQVYPEAEKQYRDLIAGYLNYILAMKMQKKGFRSSYYFDGDQTEIESPFSNGEAYLALARYYSYRPTEEIKKILDDSFVYFDVAYRKEWDDNFYLWGMAAIKDLYILEPKQEYVDFVRDYTQWRVMRHKGARGSGRNRCAYIEGVVSAYSVLEPNIGESVKTWYLEEINFWFKKSRELQLKNGGFLTGLKPEELRQRIDFTQHCLSAYFQKLVDIDGNTLVQIGT